MIRILNTSGIQMVESYPAVEWPGIPMVSLTHVTFGHHLPQKPFETQPFKFGFEWFHASKTGTQYPDKGLCMTSTL